MYWNQSMGQYFQQINSYLYSQSKQIEQLHTSIEQLKQEIMQLKEKSTPQVVRNEYKFDLLKVEKLEGTLNIGLNPNGKDSSIGEMDVSQSVDVPSDEKKKLFQDIYQQICNYCQDGGAHDNLREIEKRYGLPLEEEYRKFIIEDVRKQVDKRIQHYLAQVPDEQLTPDQLKKVEQTVINKVKEDIHKTFESFIQNLPRGGQS